MSIIKPVWQASFKDFAVIGQNSLITTWNGSPVLLSPDDNVNMPYTPDGSLVFVYENMTAWNSSGKLSYTSGASQPKFLTAPPLTNQLSVLINNWNSNNLSVTNISPSGAPIPILVQAVGPGIPGTTPLPLVIGTSLPLPPPDTAQGKLNARWMQLFFQDTSGDTSVFVFIGGPPDNTGNNAYMITVNDTINGNTGNGTNPYVQPPAGYFATTTASSYTYTFNWGGSTIFVANVSASTSTSGAVVLRQL